MNTWWAAALLVSGGLFAGGALAIAWERVPAWRAADIPEFRAAFAYTLRRVDVVQPVLLVVSLIAAVGLAIGSGGSARTLALATACCFLVVLAGSVAWLVPLQRRLHGDRQLPHAESMRARWLRGHLARTALGIAGFVLAALAVAR